MLRPLFLLADSTPMFLNAEGEVSLMERLAAQLPKNPQAAYLGASNGDDPNYFEIFCVAMNKIGIHEKRHIAAPYTEADCEWLEGCDLILLSGGDVLRGWQAFSSADLQTLFKARYQAGCILVGISAGAIQLSEFLFGDDGEQATSLARGMGLAPCLVDVHDQDRDWQRLRCLARIVPKGTRCVGIPSNGVLQISPEVGFEASGAPLFELSTGT